MALDVAITGMGVISALGQSPGELYDRLAADELAITQVPWTVDDPDRFEWWAPVTGFDPSKWMDERTIAGSDPFAQQSIAAASEALKAAGIDKLAPLRTAIVLGTAKNGTQSLERAQYDVDRLGREGVSGKLMIRVWPNMAASQVAMHWKLHGPCLTLSTACASSLDAVGLGARLIASGQADVAIVGGTEGGLAFETDDGFVPASAYSRYAYGMGGNITDPRKACQPFDRGRAGMVFGEGTGIFILESAAHAAKRGATPLAWVQGWGTAADSFHPSTPDPTGDWERLAMEIALKEAGVGPEAIDALAAHGTGTPKGDLAEIAAANTLYGKHAPNVSVMSIKGTLGHPTGAAGAIGLAVGLEGMARGEVIHTGGTHDPEPSIAFDLVLDKPRKKTVGWLQANAFGFGGQNASLVVSARQARHR
ncbi:beta-ketoacyl-[acyl-carrier-protein] synthase family protein [Sphingoaurantiacus capsulatus]|uniref:Beta-ketoacyl-[acyl-carrier-protein] synthase family protein n=1 Tax=Sphingoaurantiacus capsulatus TaxID=1771310 RepID=A0ABV7XB63_9SPHN